MATALGVALSFRCCRCPTMPGRCARWEGRGPCRVYAPRAV